ncbi:RRP12-like protein isoform X2 [Macadamia integrifolia]|uniref:RRP12-like protein isoform X2 n=1 Tax=Macadamia integrifolia TaxID=60698 RepID=UPI001C52EF62|nr:RRP12-like protein isoform X2 [Macadamia integrifolia]
MKRKAAQDIDAMAEDEQEEQDLVLAEKIVDGNSDICQRLMERYGKSSASQHRHLCASAAAMKAIIQEEGLPLTPSAYFAAAISSINDAAETSDSNATVALSSFLSILLPVVPPQSLPPSKAIDAVSVLVKVLNGPPEAVSTAIARSLIKSLGFLLLLCDVEDWGAVKVPFETLLNFSVDKRPKVRRCAQVCIENAFSSFQCSLFTEKGSKMVLSLFRNHTPSAIELNNAKVVNGSKNEILLKPEHLEVLHMLNAMKPVIPYLSDKVNLKILSESYKLLTYHFSPLTRHIFNIIEALFASMRPQIIVPELEIIITSLASYISSSEKNPMDTVISAANLIKSGLSKLHAEEPSICIRILPLVFSSLSGLLISEPGVASQALVIFKELINNHIDGNIFLTPTNVYDDNAMDTSESSAVKSICVLFEKMLDNCGGGPNEHTLGAISALFLSLGEVSFFFMRGIVIKLADLVMHALEDMSAMTHFEEGIGSAVLAMGPEKILSLIPISFNAEKLICSNIWLVPILKKYTVGASLEYLMEHIVPLAESLQRASCKVKKSPLRRELRTYACAIWDLLPAFCRYPTDTYRKFEHLAKLFISFLKKDSSMLENVALALQELVNQNRSILRSSQDANELMKESMAFTGKDYFMESTKPRLQFSKKIAKKNIKAMSVYSVELLQALTDVFFDSTPESRKYLKDAIRCMASVSETSEVKRIFLSSLEKSRLVSGMDEFDKLESHCSSVDVEHGGDSKKSEQEDSQRCMIMEFASSLVEGANQDLIGLIFGCTRAVLQATAEIGISEAYYTLSRIFEEHTWFMSSKFDDLLDLFLILKPPVDIMSLKNRFACFHILLVHNLKNDLEGNSKAFRILNEIIITLKDSEEGARKAAYDTLFMISSSLNNSSSGDPAPHQRLFIMLMGYLSGASPQITSGAVAALSLLMYKDVDICFSVPDLVPSVLALLQSKAVEVIKAALGFMKVLVSCLQANDLQKFLVDIVNGVIPWSSVSRNHFRSKVTVILEIVIRKCGSTLVEPIVPEKYKGFIKTVLEQRHGNRSSKESGNTDTALNLADSSLKGEQKRTREELRIRGGETSSKSYGTQENRKFKRKIGTPSTNKRLKSADSGSGRRWVNRTGSNSKGQLEGRSMARGKKNEKSEPTMNGKGRIGRKMENKANKGRVHRPIVRGNSKR